MKTLYIYIGGVAGAVIVSAVLAWFIFQSSPAAPATTGGTTVGSLNENANSVTPSTGTNVPSQTTQVATAASQQKVFKISDGPVAGATLVQTLYPTTTIARFVMADNGHAYDLPLDSAGAVPKAISNTTIPGALSAQWAGQSAILQYLDGSMPKTVYLGLPTAGATSSSAVRLQFYPDGIQSVAAAPDGSGAAYLLRTTAGVDGYIAKQDGTGGKKLFSLPLGQVQLRWPSSGELLAYSNEAAGVPGIAFGIDAKSGAVSPLVYAAGLSATADLSFGHVLYQTTDASGRHSYTHDIKSGGDRPLSFSPFPEKCAAVPQSAALVVCAVPLSAVSANYLDLWHQGASGAADSLVVYNLAAGTSTILATPGSTQDGGIGTDIFSLAASQDGHYLIFVSKADRSLWGVRLTQ